MKEILIFAGTTEGRKLSEHLAEANICHTVCVATEYGEIVLTEHPFVKVHRGRMNQEEIKAFIRNGEFKAVVDATHPYAEVVTENIKEAMKEMEIPYLRIKRETETNDSYEKLWYFEDHKMCAEALKEIDGNILLTTGSKELDTYCLEETLKNRLYVRVLPGIESLTLCINAGIKGKRILALQGPFSTEMNEAMIHQYDIKYLVTKESGKAGGYQEKLEAAKKTGIPVFVIGRLKEETGDSVEQVCQKLEVICGQKIGTKKKVEIILAGIGMGRKENLTREVSAAIEQADILLGAKRLIAEYQPKLDKKPFYKAEEILPYLIEVQKNGLLKENGKAVILFSGDSGFYSGCQNLYQALKEAVREGDLQASIHVMPGISSVAYLASCIGESYHDAEIYSIHGKKLNNLAKKVRTEKKLFLLVSGVKDIHKIGQLLIDYNLETCVVWVGYQLSYPNQAIYKLTPKECIEQEKEGLYICCIINPNAEARLLTHGKADTEFLRDKVPMTKEEIREISICKLKLHKGAVVYDIGSGTGSIAVEMAELSDELQVFAIEMKEEAVSLIKRNVEKFHLENVEMIQAKAPEGFLELPTPTHAFIGGSGGRLKEILLKLYQKNPQMRIVINAISMETICEIKEILSLFAIENEEIVQVQVSRSKRAGRYHLMQAENPVWICAFSFRKEVLDEA